MAEFNKRKRLAKMGFTSSLEDLDSLTAEYLISIDVMIEEEEEARSKSKKK